MMAVDGMDDDDERGWCWVWVIMVWMVSEYMLAGGVSKASG